MEDEDLSANGFWKSLQLRQHAALRDLIEHESLVVCVPIAASLPTWAIV